MAQPSYTQWNIYQYWNIKKTELDTVYAQHFSCIEDYTITLENSYVVNSDSKQFCSI